MAKYRKKPVVIDAVQWNGTVTDELRALFGDRAVVVKDGPTGPTAPKLLAIRTLEGTMDAEVGDWVIKGVAGELYPCKPHIFAATYEPVDAAPPPSLRATTRKRGA
jgi:hypothetical protein